MFRKSTDKLYSEGYRLDIIHSIYRTIGDLKMLRHIGMRDLISSMILPIKPSSEKSYRDFFEWQIADIKRCAEFNINLHVLIGIPPAGRLDIKILDGALMYMEEYIRDKKVIGIGEIGMGLGSKEEYMAMKRQLALASKYNLPVVIQAPSFDKVANTSIILKELAKAKIERAIIDKCDGDLLQLVVRANDPNIKAGITVGQQAMSPEDALKLYKNYSHTDRILFDSGLGLIESSLFGLSNTLELFEDNVNEEAIEKMFYENYLDVFPTITGKIKTTT